MYSLQVGQLSRSFQSNQPIPNPSRERTVGPVVKDDTRTVQDGRKTSRSQEIDVNFLTKNSVLEIEQGDLLKRVWSTHVHLKTARIPTLKWHMTERGDSSSKQTQKMCQKVLKHVLFVRTVRSTLETKHFAKERWDPLLTMTIQVMWKQCWTRRTWTSKFQDYHILLWSMRRVPAFDNWFRKLRTRSTCSSTWSTTKSSI